MNIVVGSSQSIVRKVLLMLLKNQRDMTVIGQAHSPEDLLAKAKTSQPDVVLVEWGLLGRSAAETIHALQDLTTQPQVIVYGWQPGWLSWHPYPGTCAVASKFLTAR